VKRRHTGASDDTRDASADVVGTDLLDFGRLIIAGMKMTTGEGEPDPGSSFRNGREGFDKAGATLRSAVPDDSWSGVGSRAYADQNTRQQLRSEAMADADEAVFAVLVRESLQIKARRDTLDTQADLLAKTSSVTFPLQFIPRYGEAAKLAIETAALNSALQLCARTLYELQSEVSANAAELGQAVGRYAGVADTATGAVDFNPPPAPDTVDSGVAPVGSGGPLPGVTTLGEGVHVR
jgi:hypothetical protein